jgi:diguanylate cyclase (GGDEF)-like protein
VDEKTNAREQGATEAPAHQEHFIQGIQDMIFNLIKKEIDKMQNSEMDKQLGSVTPSNPGDGGPGPSAAPMNLVEIKKVVSTVQRFLDNTNMIIEHLEDGSTDRNHDEDEFLDDYMTTADNILEMAAFSTKDNLTGLSNRHGFSSRLILEWNRAAREQSPLSLLIFSVDGLGQGAKGLQKSKTVLQAISKTLEQSIKRATDTIARWSDNEFAALLPVTDTDGATIVAERIRMEIENLSAPGAGESDGGITSSIGVSVQLPGQNERPADLINKAQSALKKAREAGQNKIVFDPDG